MEENHIFSHALKAKSTNPFLKGRNQPPCFGSASLPLLKQRCRRFCISRQLRGQSFTLTISPKSSTTILGSYGNYKNIKRLLEGKWREVVTGWYFSFLMLTSLWNRSKKCTRLSWGQVFPKEGQTENVLCGTTKLGV